MLAIECPPLEDALNRRVVEVDDVFEH